MRQGNALRLAALAVLLAAPQLHAQCTPTVQAVSLPAFFPNHVAGPIATNGSIVGVAKGDFTSTTPPIFFSTYDSNLKPINADQQVAASSFNGPQALYFADSANEFGLFYLRTDGTGVLQRIDVNGNPIGGPIVLPHSWSFNDEFDVVWDAAAKAYAIAHLVTSGNDLGLWVTTLTPDGKVTSEYNVSAFAGSPALPRLAVLPDGTVAMIWNGLANGIISLIRNGTLIRNVSVGPLVASPRIAANANEILVVYSVPKPPGSDPPGTDLHVIRLDGTGKILKPDAFLMSGTGVDIEARSLTWNPQLGEWALVYVDATVGVGIFPGDVHLRRFRSLTDTPSDTLLSPDPLHSRLPAKYPLLFLANGYVASIAQLVSLVHGGESYLTRLCPLVATFATNPTLARPFDVVAFTATSSGGTPGYTYAWDFGDNASATGPSVTHRYSAAGTYTVTLTGSDRAGATSIIKQTVVISDTVRGRAARH